MYMDTGYGHPREHWPRKGYGDVRPWRHPFHASPVVCKGPVSSKRVSLQDPLLRKSAHKPQIWKFPVHKPPFSEANISSQAPHFGNPSHTPLPEKKKSWVPHGRIHVKTPNAQKVVIANSNITITPGGSLPKNTWRVCAATLTPIFNLLSLNGPLFIFHILLSPIMTSIFKMFSHLMTPWNYPILRNEMLSLKDPIF